MKKIILAGAAALFATGAASAQPGHAPAGDITRAAAIADAEQRFRALDTDRSGRLEAAELEKASEQRRAQRRQRMEQRLAQMSPEERSRFEQRRGARGGEAGARRGGREGGPGAGRGPGGRGAGNAPTTLAEFRTQAEQRFDRLDLDRNGVITAAEQAQLRAERGGRSR